MAALLVETLLNLITMLDIGYNWSPISQEPRLSLGLMADYRGDLADGMPFDTKECLSGKRKVSGPLAISGFRTLGMHPHRGGNVVLRAGPGTA